MGEIATVNQELENTGVDIPKVFGPNSPEAMQLAADKDPFKDTETADYVGLGVHCAQGQAFCADAMGVGSACYIAQAQYYNAASASSSSAWPRTGSRRRTPCSSSAPTRATTRPALTWAGRSSPPRRTATVPRSPGTRSSPTSCAPTRTGTFGELSGNLTGLLATQTHNKTPFSLEADTAPEFYVTGQPGPDVASVRSRRCVASLTGANPYTGTTQPITNYLADSTEEAILHTVNADPARTPTFATFAKPDYYLQTGSATCSPCVTQDNSFAYDHGDYAAEIDTNWLGIAGPGVKHLGLDGTSAAKGPNSAGANSGQVTVPAAAPRAPGSTRPTSGRPSCTSPG